MTETCCRRGGW